MNHIKEFREYSVNENIFSEIGRLADKGFETIFSIFSPKDVKKLEDRVNSMSDDEKENILNALKEKVRKWRVSGSLISIVWFFQLITHPIVSDPGFWMTRHELQGNSHLIIPTICWFLALIMKTRNEVLRDKVKDIYKMIKNDKEV